MTTPVLADILLGQWQQSPRLRGVCCRRAATHILADGTWPLPTKFSGCNWLTMQWRVWLDYLGDRLGIERPATSDPTLDTRFGFDLAGAGFDQHPFRGDAANDAVYPLAGRHLSEVRQGTGGYGAERRHVRHLRQGGAVD